jgi:HEAT repeat protein
VLVLITVVVAAFSIRESVLEKWCLRRLASEEEQSRRYYAEKLERIGSVRALSPLIRIAYDENENGGSPAFYVGVLRRLNRSCGARAVLHLVEHCRTYGTDYILPIDLIAEHGPRAQSAVPFLVSALSDENPWVRVACVQALGKITPTDNDSRHALMRCLSDPDPAVRFNSAAALLQMGHRNHQVIQAVRDAADNQDETLSSPAREILERVRRE